MATVTQAELQDVKNVIETSIQDIRNVMQQHASSLSTINDVQMPYMTNAVSQITARQDAASE